MNEKNMTYLKDGLKYLGFGENLNETLESKIKELPAEFQLKHEAEFKKGTAIEKVDYTLEFRKSDQSDMYFFNRYQATLKNDDAQKQKSQTFYVTKNAGITAKEAYNLLSGRAVMKSLTGKEDEKNKTWLQLDFSEKDKYDNYKVQPYSEKYGYDLELTLSKYPIKEMTSNDDRTSLLASLQKGNVKAVTFAKEGKEEKMFVEANPKYKAIILYDSNMKKVFQVNEKKELIDTGKDKEKEKKQDNKIGADDDDGATKKKSSKKKGLGI